MSSYSVQVLQDKLARLSLSQDSIETLSLWMIHHKSKAKTSVAVWLEEFQKGRFSHALLACWSREPVQLYCLQMGTTIDIITMNNVLCIMLSLIIVYNTITMCYCSIVQNITVTVYILHGN